LRVLNKNLKMKKITEFLTNRVRNLARKEIRDFLDGTTNIS